MNDEQGYFVPLEETLDRAPPPPPALHREKFAAMLRAVLPGNGFYRAKLAGPNLDNFE